MLKPLQRSLQGLLGSRLSWGIAWGLGWATLINLSASSPMMNQLESLAQQQVFQWRGPEAPDPRVVIVGIDGRLEGSSNGQAVDFLLERANYAGLTLRLLGAGASVVVLNLPSSFVVPQTLGLEDLDAPLRQVIQQYPDRIVLATRSSQSFQQSELPIYNHFLPFSSVQVDYLVHPWLVQGFVQYRVDDAGILRRAQLQARFVRRDEPIESTFGSVEALALAKGVPPLASELFKAQLIKSPQAIPQRQFPWNQFHPNLAAPPAPSPEAMAEVRMKPLQFDPLGPAGLIPVLPIESICPPHLGDPCLRPGAASVLDRVKDRIVLVGFIGGYPETFPVTTAYGASLPAVELQGQILSSMLTHRSYTPLPLWGTGLVMAFTGIGVGVILMGGRMAHTGRENPARIRRGRTVLLLLTGMGLYEGLALTAFLAARWIWPMALPLLTAGLTVISGTLTLVLLYNRERLHVQQAELEGLRRAEQEAVIDQARKLLYRIATDIHDRELQDLKVVMDKIELLQWRQQEQQSQDPRAYDQLLEHLQHIGQGIRDQLNDVRTLADKLRISPALKDGLHRGIQVYLENLVTQGELRLPLSCHLQPLREVNHREWLDAREDILRFLREAMANIIGHVQPPKGTATWVEVSLTQTQQQCQLRVTNDGVEHAPAKTGGYGTKAMNTIARYLPKGSWQRSQLPDGRIQVELNWEMPHTPDA